MVTSVTAKAERWGCGSWSWLAFRHLSRPSNCHWACRNLYDFILSSFGSIICSQHFCSCAIEIGVVTNAFCGCLGAWWLRKQTAKVDNDQASEFPHQFSSGQRITWPLVEGRVRKTFATAFRISTEMSTVVHNILSYHNKAYRTYGNHMYQSQG